MVPVSRQKKTDYRCCMWQCNRTGITTIDNNYLMQRMLSMMQPNDKSWIMKGLFESWFFKLRINFLYQRQLLLGLSCFCLIDIAATTSQK